MGLGILGAVGDFLPVAMALALSPFPIIAVVLLLGGLKGREGGVAFLVGWLAGLGALTAVLALAATGVDRVSMQLGAGMQILIGLALLGGAWRKWRTRPRAGAVAKLPGWTKSLDSASPQRAASIGAMLGGLNPKSIALAYAAAAAVAVRDLALVPAILSLVLFVLLGSSSVIAALCLHAFGGPAGAVRLESAKGFLLRNSNVIMMVVFLLAGMKVLGNGLGQLGG